MWRTDAGKPRSVCIPVKSQEHAEVIIQAIEDPESLLELAAAAMAITESPVDENSNCLECSDYPGHRDWCVWTRFEKAKERVITGGVCGGGGL